MTVNRTLLQRLKQASLAELLYRGRRMIDNQWLKLRMKSGSGHLPVAVPPSYQFSRSLQVPEMVCAVDEASIGRLLAGATFCLYADQKEVELFGGQYRNCWNGDIPHDVVEPDIRAVWEPARLQHVSTLLLVAGGHPRGQFLKEYARQAVVHWIQANPFLLGPAYSSAMECGLRLPVFVYALAICEDVSDGEIHLLVEAVYRHGWWIERRLSLYASLGNHTICEAVGLVVAGIVFRQLTQGKRWLDQGLGLLNQEIDHQILDDGGPAEQSLGYHRFVLDLYWLAVGFVTCNTDVSCEPWLTRLQQGECFWQACAVDGKPGVDFGDSDDGFAVAPGIHPKRGAFHAGDPVRPQNREQRMQTFATSGHTVLRGSGGFRLLFDHGPLGMPPLYNHGHADALSLTVSKNGVPLLVDPGTYRYNGASQWRHYFKSTRAHNTVTVDGEDQAVQTSGWTWGQPFRCRLVGHGEVEGGTYLRAEHDGYQRLGQAVGHIRSILCAEDGPVVIRDRFTGSGTHTFEAHFHCHPGAEVSSCEGGWRIAHHGEVLYLLTTGECLLTCVNGAQSPILGWFSAAYGVKEPCTVLTAKAEGTPGDIAFMTVLSPKPTNQFERYKEQCNAIEQQITDS
ncbi:MAG: heparinase II/III family protein [Porticoccaceae bacterium]